MSEKRLPEFVRYVVGLPTDVDEQGRVSTIRCYTAAGEVVGWSGFQHIDVREVKWAGGDNGMAYTSDKATARVEWPPSQPNAWGLVVEAVEITETDALSIVIAEHAKRESIHRAYNALKREGIV